MSNRKKDSKKGMNRREVIKRRRRKSNIKWSAGIIMITIVVSMIFLYLIKINPGRPIYTTCFSLNKTEFTYKYDAKLFITIGEEDENLMIKIPPELGIEATCKWPITTGKVGVQGERGANWTKIHIASPYEYRYTLGDFFRIWNEQEEIYYGIDGIANVTGDTYVSVNYGIEIPFDQNMVINPNDFIVIHVHSPWHYK